MQTINQYKFKNKKIIQICHISKQDQKKNPKIPYVDNLLFHWSMDNGKSFRDGLYIRPDEAIIIAKQLLDAVYKTTKAYQEGLLKKKDYYGYKEFKL